MKIYYKGNKAIEILILSIAIVVAVVTLIVLNKSFWFILPYLLLEIVLLYFLLNFEYMIENKVIKIKYAFFLCKQIPIQSIEKIIICEKQKFEPTNYPHRIKIYYSYNKMKTVTPKQTVSFVENIERLRPGIEII